MHCPKCGQQQVSEETRFCSRCGLLLTEIANVVANEGKIPGKEKGKTTSARLRGLKQGVFFFMLALLIVPIAAIITVATDSEPYVAAGLFFLTVVGGLLRVIYALMFESGEPGSTTFEENVVAGTGKVLKRKQKKAELNAAPANSEFYSAPQGQTWLDTNELASPPPASVTDNTTKLLQKDEDQ